MDEEEQRRIDDEARAAALRAIQSVDEVAPLDGPATPPAEAPSPAAEPQRGPRVGTAGALIYPASGRVQNAAEYRAWTRARDAREAARGTPPSAPERPARPMVEIGEISVSPARERPAQTPPADEQARLAALRAMQQVDDTLRVPETPPPPPAPPGAMGEAEPPPPAPQAEAPRAAPPPAPAPARPQTADRAAALGSPVARPAPPPPDSPAAPAVNADAPAVAKPSMQGPRDMTGVDVGDAFRRVGAGIGNFLGAFAGRPGQQFVSERSRIEAQDRADKRDYMDREENRRRYDEARADRLSERGEAREMQRAMAEQQAEARRGQIDLARMREERQMRQAEAQQALLDARTSRERVQAQQLINASDPDSGESDRARKRFELRLSMYPDAVRARLRDVDLTELSAADIAALERELPNQSIGERSGRPGGGGGTATPGGRPRSETRTQMLEEAGRLGIPESAAAALTDRQLASEIALRSRGRADPNATREILPGVMARASLTSESDGVRMREGFVKASTHYGSLQRILANGQRYGAAERITDPRVRAQITADIASMRSMYAAIQGTGTINTGEAPLIEAQIPNPDNLRQMTFGELEDNVRSFESLLISEIVAGLDVRGVDQEGINRALAILRRGGNPNAQRGPAASGGQAPATQSQPARSSGPMVRITRSRDGQTLTIPANDPRVAQLRGTAGYTVEEVR